MEIVNVPLYGPDVVRAVVGWRDETGRRRKTPLRGCLVAQ